VDKHEAQENVSRLTRAAASVTPQAEHCREVHAGLTAQVPRPAFSALTCTHRARFPGAASARDRLRADSAATFLPDSSTVPLADLVMFFRLRSSTTSTACAATRSLTVCRAQFC
jgi:hypothetical protein